MTITRLRLNHDEKSLLINAAAEAFQDEPTLGIWGAIERGIEKLPPERRPSIRKAKTWSWLVPSVQETFAQLRQQQQVEEKEPEPIDLTAIPTDQLLQELADRFVADAVDKIRHTVEEGIKTEIQSIIAVPVKTEKRKKKITIIGLLKRQEQLIKREFGKEYDLKFHKVKDKGNPGTGFVSLCKEADYVLAMISFIGHNTESSIRSVAKSYIRIPGGMTMLRDKLTELYIQ